MEYVRERMEMQLVSDDLRIQKLINRPTFKLAIRYNENLIAIALDKTIITFNKPMYIGFAVLEVSKTLMFDYHYNVMKKHYNSSIKLMYNDTGKIYITYYSFNIYIIYLEILCYRFIDFQHTNRRFLCRPTSQSNTTRSYGHFKSIEKPSLLYT